MKGKTLEPYSLKKEEEIRSYWEKEKIPEKARKQNEKAKDTFYFMDGPPYATGHIHMGTALNKILKDIAIRYWRMNGFNVFDRPGYDTHGLPIEHKIETKLGFKGKKDIERFGVKKFINECRDFATKYIGTMNDEFNNLGIWMDWSNPYKTLTNDYIEAIWYAFKKAEEKGLLYKGKYPVHLCPRCATAVAYNEIEYTKLTDEAIYVKFPAKEEKTFFIIWTTTPWTLPGNTGIMVHPDYDYAFVELSNGEVWVIAEKLVKPLMEAIEAGYKIRKVVKGKELEGMTYESPLKPYLKLPELKNAYRVVLSARYVHLEEGTGLVHTAPGHGKEDFDAGMKTGLPAISPVNNDGTLTEEAGKYAGGKCREIDKEIVADLEKDGLLIYRHPFTHDYPVCWRCKTPLLMLGSEQWFLKISDIQKKLLEENKKVKWYPKWMQDRMINWLEQLGDWPVSRKRFWGTPLPIWLCDKCEERKVIGSFKELQKLAKVPEEMSLHKPEIDEVTFPCKCGGTMKRIPDVLDVWFDSGVSSWGALGFPESKELFDKFWPADLNIEGTDQFRGWWNSQSILSVICFDKLPYKAVSVHGIVLALSKKKMGLKEKMSKSLGNIVTPAEVIEKYNRDYLRFLIASIPRGEDMVFDWEAFKDINRFFNVFWNAFNFINLYLELNPAQEKISAKLEPEDRWLLSRFNSLVEVSQKNFEEYNYAKIVQEAVNFVLEELSRTYIKLIRDRVGSKTEPAVKETLSYVSMGLLKLLSPIVPHITEYIYQNIKEKNMPESVHLLGFPEVEKKLQDKKLEEEMALVKDVTAVALSLREQAKLRLRWPLEELVVEAKKPKIKKLADVLKTMANVKKVTFTDKKPEGDFVSGEVKDLKVHLNKSASKELKEEWEFRELVRKIQAKRKELKFNPHEIVRLFISSSDPAFLDKFKAHLEKETNTKITVKEGKKEKLLFKEFSLELKK